MLFITFPKIIIRIGPDRAYPLHFTHLQLLLLLPVLLLPMPKSGFKSKSGFGFARHC